MAEETNNGGKAYDRDARWIKGKLDDHAVALDKLTQGQNDLATNLAVISAALPEIRSGIVGLQKGVVSIQDNMIPKAICDARNEQLKNELTANNYSASLEGEVPRRRREDGDSRFQTLSKNGFLQTLLTAFLVGGLSFGAFKCNTPGGWSCEGKDFKKAPSAVEQPLSAADTSYDDEPLEAMP